MVPEATDNASMSSLKQPTTYQLKIIERVVIMRILTPITHRISLEMHQRYTWESRHHAHAFVRHVTVGVGYWLSY